MISSAPADVVGAALIVTEVVDTDAAQPPEAAILLVTVYVPGVLRVRSICPVEALMFKPAVEVNVPALAPAPKVGEGFGPVAWQ
jgi:hypothetical protein